MFNIFKSKEAEKKSTKATYLVMLFAALFALAAAFVLTMEKLHIMNDPDAILSCTFNLVLNCSAVMQTWQASVFFGVPNMYFGLMAFPVIVTVAVAGLWGVRFPKSFLVATNLGILLGTIFSYWLFFSSVYVIEILCPWCLIVTTACTLLLATSTKLALRENAYNLQKKINEKVQKFLDAGYHQLIVASWIVLMIALVVLKFGPDLFA